MRILVYILMILSIALVIYNGLRIDFNDPFGDESIVAVITSIAAVCAFMVLAILRTSQRIKETLKGK